MKFFAEDLQTGLDDVLADIHPVKDGKSGISLRKEETRELLQDISNNLAQVGDISEDDDESEDEDESSCRRRIRSMRLRTDEDFQKFEREVQKAAEKWSDDPLPSYRDEIRQQIRDEDAKLSAVPAIVPLTSTPPQTAARPVTPVMVKSGSFLSNFSSPLT